MFLSQRKSPGLQVPDTGMHTFTEDKEYDSKLWFKKRKEKKERKETNSILKHRSQIVEAKENF